MRQKALKPMKVVLKPQIEKRTTPLVAAFRAIPGIRAKWAEDDTIHAPGRGRVKGRDNMYPHSPTRIGVYIERPSVGQFHGRIKKLVKELDSVKGVEYNLGDRDGIITFPWEAATRIRDFFRKVRHYV
jgi:hypothetical protein